jgi:hypothetical protein
MACTSLAVSQPVTRGLGVMVRQLASVAAPTFRFRGPSGACGSTETVRDARVFETAGAVGGGDRERGRGQGRSSGRGEVHAGHGELRAG